jgi:hypothetical protein
MAARIHKIRHDDETRAKIQASQLINRLSSYALGEQGVELDANRIRAIDILLKKSLPDLTSVEHSGEQQHDVTIGWKLGTSKSTTSQENSSSPSTTEPSDLPVLSPTDEPVKP